jgi:hypothetical protein
MLFILFAYVQRGYYCHCGNSIKYPTTASTCDRTCDGNSAQYCGDSGGKYHSVYSQAS